MDVEPIRGEQDYGWAIREVARYFEVDPALRTAGGDRFEVLSILIKDYEEKHFAASHGDPVDVLHFAIVSMGRSQAELALLIGRNRASEVLQPRSAPHAGNDPCDQQGMAHTYRRVGSSI